MRVVAIIQARLSSQRLPGKVLRPLAGQPLIGHLCDSLAHANALDGLVLATSVDESDEQLAEYAQARALPCFRGSLANVAERMLAAAVSQRADLLVRISGDSPLLDPKLVDQAVELASRTRADVATNVQTRSFPKGQSVEVVTTAALERAVQQMTQDAEREHVTPYLYAHPKRFAIRSFTAPRPRPEVQLSVDTAEDFVRCEAIIRALACPPWQAGWQACVDAYDAIVGAQAAAR